MGQRPGSVPSFQLPSAALKGRNSVAWRLRTVAFGHGGDLLRPFRAWRLQARTLKPRPLAWAVVARPFGAIHPLALVTKLPHPRLTGREITFEFREDKMSRKIGLGLCTLVFLLTAGTLAFSASRIEKDLKLEPGGRLVVDAGASDVFVTGRSASGAHVVVTSNQDDLEELFTLNFSEEARGGPHRDAQTQPTALAQTPASAHGGGSPHPDKSGYSYGRGRRKGQPSGRRNQPRDFGWRCQSVGAEG